MRTLYSQFSVRSGTVDMVGDAEAECASLKWGYLDMAQVFMLLGD